MQGIAIAHLTCSYPVYESALHKMLKKQPEQKYIKTAEESESREKKKIVVPTSLTFALFASDPRASWALLCCYAVIYFHFPTL